MCDQGVVAARGHVMSIQHELDALKWRSVEYVCRVTKTGMEALISNKSSYAHAPAA
jgi:hypothetical protein